MDKTIEEELKNDDSLADPPVKKAVKKSKKAVKFKKAPQAPRRFKSAYMFFSTAKHPEIRARITDNGKSATKTTHVAKLVSEEWKSLGKEEREKWEEMARKDKARFEIEKSRYTGPWKVPKRKGSDRDPNEPKRPMSSFLSYSNSMRSAVKKEFPNMNNAEISRVLAQRWKEAPEDERQIHINKEKKLREEYKIAITEYKKKIDAEIEAQRVQQEEAPHSNPSGESIGPNTDVSQVAQGYPDYPDYSAYNNYYSQNAGPEGSGHVAPSGTSVSWPAYYQRDDGNPSLTPSSSSQYHSYAYRQGSYNTGYSGSHQAHYDYATGGYGYYPSQYAPGSYSAGYEGQTGPEQNGVENTQYNSVNSERRYEHDQSYNNISWYNKESQR